MPDIANTYGLLLRTENRYGSDYLVAEIVRREGDHHAPRNCSDNRFTSDQRPKHLAGLALEHLRIEGWATEFSDRPNLIGFEPRYHNVYAIDENLAICMARTLKRINERIEKDEAHHPVDVFSSLCAALRLSFAVERCESYESSTYDDNRWHWMTVGEGRNRYRAMVDAMTKTADRSAA